jgi:coenzyme F420 hydrogenase subunit beta
MEKGLKELKEEVLGTEICTGCGTCVSLCPNIISIEDRIAAIGDCRVASGRCYRYCPRTVPLPEFEDRLFGDVGYRGAVGPYLKYCMAQSTLSDKQASFQYGGVVTSLLLQALKEGLMNCAVVTRAVSNFPFPVTVFHPKGILSAGRSKFALSPTNKETNASVLNAGHRIGVVGLPCQSTGLKKRELMPGEDAHPEGKVTLNIGLFCTWAVSQKGWRSIVNQHVGKATIKKIDIPPPPANIMEINTIKKRIVIPLDEVKRHVRSACQVCLDMTAENADLSVGMVEGREKYNTIIVRTELGESLLESAVKSKYIKIAPLDDERWRHLNKASINKKKRAITEAEKRKGSLPYYERIIRVREKIEKEI